MTTARIKVLGTGTSTGVPIPCCRCKVCTSTEPRNKRLRASIYIELVRGDQSFGILVDTTPDLRYQALRANIPRVDAVLITHTHADHIFGMDDLRGFNFSQNSSIPVFASESSVASLARTFHYCFFPDESYQGGAPPALTLQTITPYTSIEIADQVITPLPVLHGSAEVFGFRLGNFAYLTDCSEIPEETVAHLSGLETLILDGLRFRAHPTHFSLSDAAAFADRIAPDKTYLTHLSHEVDYTEGNTYLREIAKSEVALAYDGLEFEFEL